MRNAQNAERNLVNQKKGGWLKFFVIGLLIGLGITLWFFSPVLSDALAAWQLLTPPANGFNFTVRGQFGDSFGFATSLFSFLSFLGVLGVFFLQQRSSDVREKPFIVASIPQHSSPLKILWEDGSKDFRISLHYAINNYSEHLAHSCHFGYLLSGAAGNNILGQGHVRHRPVINRIEDEVVEHSWVCDVDKYKWFLDQISRREDVKLSIKLTYQNGNGIVYSNRNNFLVRLTDGKLDLDAVNDLRVGNRDEKHWGGGKFIALKVREADPFLDNG